MVAALLALPGSAVVGLARLAVAVIVRKELLIVLSCLQKVGSSASTTKRGYMSRSIWRLLTQESYRLRAPVPP